MNKGKCKIRHTRTQALVLVAVLWAIVLLAVIVTVVARASRLDTRVSLATGEQMRGKWACRAGVEKALALLNDDLKASDCLTEYWSDSDVDCNDIELLGAVFSIRIIDEASKLNINTAGKKQLLELPEMTEALADAIIDWRDENQTAEPEGAESGYYRNQTVGYDIRNGPFRTVRELLRVKDVLPELLYGEDTDLNGRLDENESDAEQSMPADNGDEVLDEGWLAYVTCYSCSLNQDAQANKRLNINKADENKLVESLKIKKSQAKWIVENRSKNNQPNNQAPAAQPSSGNQNTDNQNPDNRNQPSNEGQFKSIADLIDKDSAKKATKEESDQPEKIDLETFGKIADQITVTDDERLLGLVNINTAGQVVLTALLEGDDKLADKIIAHRQTRPDGMTSIGELLDIETMKIETFKQIAAQITTRSCVFSVHCFARTEQTAASCRLEAVLDRAATPAEILYLHQGVNY